MEKDSDCDLISDLPESIIETILTKLPIRDAVRTSVISTRWRYRWASMTHLVFDDRSATDYTDPNTVRDRVENFVTKFLLLHNGPIHKFSICSSHLGACPIDQWLLFISRKDVKEVVIELGEDEWFRAPSCLFSCKNLTGLELVYCELNPPPNFKGFPWLKNLNLHQIAIPPDDIECLISSCPLLENLSMSYFDGVELTIRAPNLKYLVLEGEFKDICLANTPRLVNVSVLMYMTDHIANHFEQSSSCNFDKFLGGVPKLERLTGHLYFTKFLSIGNRNERRPMTYHQLKFIELYQVSFEDINEVLVVLKLIVNCPNLKSLQISGSTSAGARDPDLQFWDKNISEDSTLHELKTVKLTDVSGVPLEMRFIKFLLEHSPVLEEMTVTPSSYVTEGRLSMLIDLVSFRRASPQASIVFVHKSI
ncbi:F-box/RNI-like superfamily protein [Perilla frutescens var. hirtella]|nr:F-box/RNI-like superfamily protein [Perilla frutescens var. hirtella]